MGGGGGGLPAALFGRWLGNDVILLEKAPELGGTAAKPRSGTGCRTTRRCARSARRTARRIWDQRSQDGSASDEYGRLIAPPGADDAHVVRGDTLDDLAAGLRERLARYAGVTGGLALTGDFTANLRATIERFNGFARAGVDEDFGRGERPVQLLFNGDVAEQPGGTNPTMWPIADSGPYYAALVTGGTLDTKGGPKTDTEGRVLDDLDAPIPGLYGVGNCVASVSGAVVLGGRRDARPDHRVRLPRRAGERPRGGAGARGRGRLSGVS